jgi:hypothetical protein
MEVLGKIPMEDLGKIPMESLWVFDLAGPGFVSLVSGYTNKSSCKIICQCQKCLRSGELDFLY